ncbi:TraX family protein [Bifidobacterium bifidum]|uniref:TraX family protein n=1 Tax=Bifidobacterium bifidum TaxID=1681 RepID=UPI003D061754
MWRYGLRLLVTAVVAEAPYDKIVTGRWWDWSVMNPIFGLLIALVVLTLLDWARRRYAGVVRGVPALSQ